MVMSKPSARWTARLFNQTTRTARSTYRPRSWQNFQRRAYASEGEGKGHSTVKSGLAGDLPWAIGAAIVTIPSTWYLMQPQIERWNRPKGSGHGGHGHDEHEEHDEESEGGEGDQSAEEQDSAEKGGEGENETKEGGDNGEESEDSGSEGGEQDTPDTSDDEGGEDNVQIKDSGNKVEGVQFKGATSAGDNKEQDDTRKSYPDAKGGNKKRIESHYGKRQGVASEPQQDPRNEDEGATSKEVDDKYKTSMSGKQEGLSNTDTKHSTDIASDPTSAMKSDGNPETAKNKGTINPHTPKE